MKPRPIPPIPDQIALVAHIAKLFGRREAKPRHFNAIIKAANDILAEFAREDRIVEPGAGLAAWLNSDDTGLSSIYMATIMTEIGVPRFAYPHDGADFGRCYRMLRCIGTVPGGWDRIAKAPAPWPRLIVAWMELEALYETELTTGAAPRLYARLRELTTP